MRAARVLPVLVGLASALLASQALGGTPLPVPPFLPGGFVPPDKATLKQESDVRALLEKYYVKRQLCRAKALRPLQHGYAASSPGAIAKARAKWSACDAKVVGHFLDDAADLLGNGVPACIDQARIDALRAAADALMATQSAIAFCDGDGAAPDPVVGIDVPDKQREADGEAGVSGLVSGAARHTGSCLAVAVRTLVAHGSLSAHDVDKLDGCLLKSGAVTSSRSFAKLENAHKLPPCLSPVTIDPLVDGAQLFGTALASATYCASPSGAFVDGLPRL